MFRVESQSDDCVIIVGGGIGGLTLALMLHARRIPFRVYESTAEFRQLGVGLNLLPHAMKELALLGLEEKLSSKGVMTEEYCFFTRNGQMVFGEPRGKFAGYDWPQLSIHRGDLHATLVEALIERAGPDVLVMGHKCVDVGQDDQSALVTFKRATNGELLPVVRGRIAIACDGVHSVARAKMHRDEAVPRYEGTTQYRGTTRWKPFLTGATMFYLGTYETGKLILYPVRNNIDAEGRQLVNWVVEISRPTDKLLRDWNRESDVEEFIDSFEHCSFDWLDIPSLLRAADKIYEYPMMDQEPLPFWTQGRVTLLGDAAHPMMPRGSNGAAQAIIDARALADLLASELEPEQALKIYDAKRREATGNVVVANRGIAPDAILRVVEERTGGARFEHIHDIISEDELRAWQERYRKIAGFAAEDLKQG